MKNKLEQIREAYKRIKHEINHTPVMTSRQLDSLLPDTSVFVKCENFQKVGAFKFRGAFNAIVQLSDEEKKNGIITHSSGNHAQAVALSAKKLNIKATIVMPSNSPKVKKSAVRGYDANIIECKPTLQAREETTQKLIDKHNFTFIHPYNNKKVIFGAGTCCYELLKDYELDMIFAPVGGGGLVSGTSLAAKGLNKSIQVIGVEPQKADDAYRSFKSNELVPSENPNTIADGLLTSLCQLTFSTIKENVDDIVTVSEQEILNAMQFLWERMKLVVEPSGAVSLAGLLTETMQTRINDKKVGVIISGGNLDLNPFFELYHKKIAHSRS